MLVMDNPQETKIGWFVGILEGEGSFRNTTKSNIEVRISNTDLDIIEACERFLKKNGINFVTMEGNKRIRRRIEYTISIRNSREQTYNWPEKLYAVIENKLECRNDQYQHILGSSTTTRSPSIDVDWLIGIYEAEASFSMGLNYRGDVQLSIAISNTNEKILQKIAINLKAIDCVWYTSIKQLSKQNPNWKDSKSIDISGIKRCKYFLEATEDKWISARNIKRASLMLEFVRSRHIKDRREPYTDRQLSIIQSVRDLNA